MADQCIPTLSTPLLLKQVRDVFDLIADHRQLKKSTISLADTLMSGLAVFALKCPSLLKFDEQREEEHIRHNLHHLYGIDSAPCDTQLRAILDPVMPSALYPAYHALFECVNRAGVLNAFVFWMGRFCSPSMGRLRFRLQRFIVMTVRRKPRDPANVYIIINCLPLPSFIPT